MPSSVVARIEYDTLSHTLRIVYVSGMMYDYKNVPEQIYAAMKTAFSKGTFLNKYIKGKYEFDKVER
jgi:hypothetical protein